MIKAENVHVYNIARAVYSARNPLNSWPKSDSDLEHDILGENDLNLARRLYKAGPEHRKYLRQILVTMDITAPLYWYKQFDTYKVGTATNSCSTMHKIAAKEFEISDFSFEHIFGDKDCTEGMEVELLQEMSGEPLYFTPMNLLNNTIDFLNFYREKYLETNDKRYWWQMVQLLPSSYNQRRTVTMNYENVVTIIKQRSGHKLDEWNELIAVLRELPYVKEIMGI